MDGSVQGLGMEKKGAAGLERSRKDAANALNGTLLFFFITLAPRVE